MEERGKLSDMRSREEQSQVKPSPPAVVLEWLKPEGKKNKKKKEGGAARLSLGFRGIQLLPSSCKWIELSC